MDEEPDLKSDEPLKALQVRFLHLPLIVCVVLLEDVRMDEDSDSKSDEP